MVTGIAGFPNRPFNLRIEVWYNWQSGLVASIHVEVWVDKLSYSPTQSSSGSSFEVYVDGAGRVAAYNGGYDFVNGNNFLLHASDHQIGLPTSGDAGAQAYVNLDIIGYAQTGATVDGVGAGVPPAPSPFSPPLDQITTTSMRYRFNGNGDGGSPITSWALEYDTYADFRYGQLQGSSGTSVVGGLNPGTTYYFHSRGQNAIGVGPWSAVSQATTLPSVPPGLSVSPSLSGLEATVTMTPPGGISGVTEYNYEYRVFASGTSVPGTSTTGVVTVTGLIPGTSYEWRANAEIGQTYTSPWTEWQAVLQPNPNTNPGDYFDGATTDTPYSNYSWTGAANNSTSTSVAPIPTGWEGFTTGGSCVVSQASGGWNRASAARVTFIADSTGAGQFGISGLQAATVAGNAAYFGSMYVKPSRSQRVHLSIIWLTSGLGVISPSAGADVVLSAGVWTRLTASGTAPANAAKAVLWVYDSGSGTGWSTWKGGDTLDMDAAMLTLGQLMPYFDGATSDTEDYQYVWDGTADASPSIRSVNSTFAEDPLADPDCPPVPLPPLPPIIASDCIVEVGVWRRYMVEVPASEVALWSSTLPTIILSTNTTAERQVRIRVHSNPDGVAPDQIDFDQWEAELILTYIPPKTVMTLDSVTQRVRAEVNGAASITANQLLYGTDGVPATWPELRCGVAHVLTLDVPLEAPAGNLSARVLVTSRV